MSRPEPDNQETKEAIEAVFVRGAAAWNRRDLNGYLSTYADGDHVRWVSGGQLTTGKTALRKALEPRFASGEAMGKLAIRQLQIEIQTPSDAMVFGSWHLRFDRAEVSGVFTVHLQLAADRWLILSDHASVIE